jgi:hypothetical protein
MKIDLTLKIEFNFRFEQLVRVAKNKRKKINQFDRMAY